MLQKGFSKNLIANHLGRFYSCIYKEIKKYGEIPYNAELAHQKYLERMSNTGRKKTSNGILITSNEQITIFDKIEKDSLCSRIENLEMQIEILFETIKEIKNEKNK